MDSETDLLKQSLEIAQKNTNFLSEKLAKKIEEANFYLKIINKFIKACPYDQKLLDIKYEFKSYVFRLSVK